jgi:hypothetical protein
VLTIAGWFSFHIPSVAREPYSCEKPEVELYLSSSYCNQTRASSRRPLSERAQVRATIRARFWREWADQRASRTEGPCAWFSRVHSVFWIAIIRFARRPSWLYRVPSLRSGCGENLRHTGLRQNGLHLSPPRFQRRMDRPAHKCRAHFAQLRDAPRGNGVTMEF